MCSFSVKFFAIVLGLLLLISPVALANPVLMHAPEGVKIDTSVPNTTIIHQTPQKAIIDWHSHNIAAHETMHYQQPAGGVTLSRVHNGQPTEIFGKLTATGKVILVNGAGIHFAPGAAVNVGGLIASTLDISDIHFNAGHYIFDRPGQANARVINHGHIQAAQHGLVALIGSHVENNGIIEAQLGTVAMGAGEKVTMGFGPNDQLIHFTVDDEMINAKHPQVKSVVKNNGKIYVEPGHARRVLDSTINMDGVQEATHVSQVNGKIILHSGSHGFMRRNSYAHVPRRSVHARKNSAPASSSSPSSLSRSSDSFVHVDALTKSEVDFSNAVVVERPASPVTGFDAELIDHPINQVQVDHHPGLQFSRLGHWESNGLDSEPHMGSSSPLSRSSSWSSLSSLSSENSFEMDFPNLTELAALGAHHSVDFSDAVMIEHPTLLSASAPLFSNEVILERQRKMEEGQKEMDRLLAEHHAVHQQLDAELVNHPINEVQVNHHPGSEFSHWEPWESTGEIKEHSALRDFINRYNHGNEELVSSRLSLSSVHDEVKEARDSNLIEEKGSSLSRSSSWSLLNSQSSGSVDSFLSLNGSLSVNTNHSHHSLSESASASALLVPIDGDESVAPAVPEIAADDFNHLNILSEPSAANEFHSSNILPAPSPRIRMVSRSPSPLPMAESSIIELPWLEPVEAYSVTDHLADKDADKKRLEGGGYEGPHEVNHIHEASEALPACVSSADEHYRGKDPLCIIEED